MSKKRGIERTYMQLYLDEFCYRFNRAVSMNISLKGWLWLLLTVIGWVMSKVHNHNKLIKKL